MQPIQFLPGKRLWPILPFSILAFILLNITACEEKAPKEGCITLSRSQVKKAWVNPGFTEPGSKDQISYLKFITCYNPVNKEFNMNAQAFKGDYTPIGKLVKLKTGNSCPADLPTFVIGEINYDFSNFEIIDSAGNLKDFGYINIIPKIDYYQGIGIMGIRIQVMDKTGKTTAPIDPPQGLPCPPCENCRPSCPATCTPPCLPPHADSLRTSNKNIDSLGNK